MDRDLAVKTWTEMNFQDKANSSIISRVSLTPNQRHFFCISRADIDKTDRAPAAFQTVRSLVNVVKIRQSNVLQPHTFYSEIQILAAVAGRVHPNIVKVLGTDRGYSDWIHFNYPGPTLEIIDRFEHRFSRAFVWSLFSDISAGLAYLHWGLLANWFGSTGGPPSVWNPIAYRNVSLQSISLSMTDLTADGYPRAILTDFSCAIKQTDVLQIDRLVSCEAWLPAKNDVSKAATMLQKILDEKSYVSKLSDILSGSTDKHDKNQLTSAAWLGVAQDRRDSRPLGHPGGSAIAESDFAKLREQLPSNEAIRDAIPKFQGIFENAEDVRANEWDLCDL